MLHLHAVVARVPAEELARVMAAPATLSGYRLEPLLTSGRGVDLGRSWEELGALLEGGIRTPETGPTVGEVHITQTEDGVVWNGVQPAVVVAWSDGALALTRDAFLNMYRVDEDETADCLPGEQTGEWGDRSGYLWERLARLQALYRDAAAAGEGLLVRLGPQRRARPR